MIEEYIKLLAALHEANKTLFHYGAGGRFFRDEDAPNLVNAVLQNLLVIERDAEAHLRKMQAEEKEERDRNEVQLPDICE